MIEPDSWLVARWSLGGAVAALGMMFALIAVLGLFRRRPVAVSAHAIAACDTLAWPLVVIGLAIAAWDGAITGAGLALLIVRWATTPSSLQALLAADATRPQTAQSETSSTRHG